MLPVLDLFQDTIANCLFSKCQLIIISNEVLNLCLWDEGPNGLYTSALRKLLRIHEDFSASSIEDHLGFIAYGVKLKSVLGACT